ncbi:MAG TPA: flavin reductase family protein [Thermoguttaceae bacterium]|nr:flavin reductase family protein [Thermoguttaceae bacterium]
MLREASATECIKRFRVPQRVVLATSVKPDGSPNALALGWKMQTSHEPPMVAISIGFSRYSHDLIADSGEFVLSVPPASLADAVFYIGTKSGRDADKFAETGLTPLPATKVKAPLIGECLVNLECVVEGKLASGDHTIFAGRVVAGHVSDDADCPLLIVSGEDCYETTGGSERYRLGRVRAY